MGNAEPATNQDVTPLLDLRRLTQAQRKELLEDLIGRLSDVFDAQEQMQSLVDAVVGIGADLDLHSVLQRIIVAASQLAGAQYGALGVLGPHERLSDFITYGIDEETHRRIGALPEGHGILGLLIAQPKALRLTRISDHPDSYGFPAHHPPMSSFLGVPIRIRGSVFGNLYLTNKEGGEDFTERDEQMVTALATAAGFVIENARLYQRSERGRRWLEASSEIMDLMLGPFARHQVLTLIARRAREVSGAAGAGIFLAGLEDSGFEVTDSVGGIDMAAWQPEASDIQRVMSTGESVVLSEEHAVGHETNGHGSKIGRAVLVPMVSGGAVTGVLITVARTGAPPSTREDDELLASFAAQAALALDRAQAQEDREALAVLADRDRIARDLHDLAIQRLFATALQLQATNSIAVRPEVRERLNSAVEELDATIRQIRGTIFELRHPSTSASLRAQLSELAREYADVLGFRPHIRVDGPVDTVSGRVVSDHLMAVAREALSNVARHAGASEVTLAVAVQSGDLVLRVADNGVGADDFGEGNGLCNIRERAERLGGSARLGAADPAGAVLEWRVPFSASS